MDVFARLECIDLENDNGRLVPSVALTCERCGKRTESFGTHDRSVKRCLTLLREDCPNKERNRYIESYHTARLPSLPAPSPDAPVSDSTLASSAQEPAPSATQPKQERPRKFVPSLEQDKTVVSVLDDKYRFYKSPNGTVICLRHGEAWMEFNAGARAIWALIVALDETRKLVAATPPDIGTDDESVSTLGDCRIFQSTQLRVVWVGSNDAFQSAWKRIYGVSINDEKCDKTVTSYDGYSSGESWYKTNLPDVFRVHLFNNGTNYIALARTKGGRIQ